LKADSVSWKRLNTTQKILLHALQSFSLLRWALLADLSPDVNIFSVVNVSFRQMIWCWNRSCSDFDATTIERLTEMAASDNFTLPGGVYTAIITPFTEDGSNVDYATLDQLVKAQLAGGVTGIVPVRSTTFVSCSASCETRLQDW
jgi:hypothetical protein